jgi:hypothetical protein
MAGVIHIVAVVFTIPVLATAAALEGLAAVIIWADSRADLGEVSAAITIIVDPALK